MLTVILENADHTEPIYYAVEIYESRSGQLAWRYCEETNAAGPADFRIRYTTDRAKNPAENFCGCMKRLVTGGEATALLDMTLPAAALDRLRELLYEAPARA